MIVYNHVENTFWQLRIGNCFSPHRIVAMDSLLTKKLFSVDFDNLKTFLEEISARPGSCYIKVAFISIDKIKLTVASFILAPSVLNLASRA